MLDRKRITLMWLHTYLPDVDGHLVEREGGVEFKELGQQVL